MDNESIEFYKRKTESMTQYFVSIRVFIGCFHNFLSKSGFFDPPHLWSQNFYIKLKRKIKEKSKRKAQHQKDNPTNIIELIYLTI